MTAEENALPKLLFIDDDRYFPHAAARALARRGFDVSVAHDHDSALALSGADTAFAVVDLVLGNASGLALLPKLKAVNPSMKILVLTGYASIDTAVDAIRRGAENYLAKPVDADTIVAALRDNATGTENRPHPKPLPLNRLESAHIKRVLADCDGNISAAARALNMHRRTLQRKLARSQARR